MFEDTTLTEVIELIEMYGEKTTLMEIYNDLNHKKNEKLKKY